MRVSWAGLLLSSILVGCAARPVPPPARELVSPVDARSIVSPVDARSSRPSQPVKVSCDDPPERLERLAAQSPATAPNPVRATLMAATANERLGQWASAAERWRELAALDPAWPRGAVWRGAALDALIRARRWDALCSAAAEYLAAQPAQSSTTTLSDTMWIPSLHGAALDDATPEALSAARCVNEAAAAQPQLGASGRLRRLRALLDCAAGDRAGAVAELTALAATSTATWAYDAGIDAARIRAEQPCAPRGPLETTAHEVSLSKDEIAKVIERSRDRFKGCYEPRLDTYPDSRGRVIVRFFIEHEGSVLVSMIAGTTMDDPWTEECVLERVSSLRFPVAHPGNGLRGATAVVYPFVFCSTL